MLRRRKQKESAIATSVNGSEINKCVVGAEAEIYLPKPILRRRIADGVNRMNKYTRDKERMDEIAERLSERQDIWQDRYVYWIAVALGHILEYITRKTHE